MWWTKGVSSAISTCQQRKSVLIVLVEPPTALMAPSDNSRSESNKNLYARLATTSLHTITFSSKAVTDTIKDSQAISLKFPSETSNPDFNSFTQFFTTSANHPNLYFISPLSGATLNFKEGFVSPNAFLEALVTTTKTVSGRTISFTKPVPHYTTPSFNPLDNPPDSPPLASNPAPAPEPISTPSEPSSAKAMKLPADPPSDPNPPIVHILARLPDGKQLRKQFSPQTPFRSIRTWLAEELSASETSLLILRTFPRRIYDASENPKMLSELGLTPSATLTVSRQGAVDSPNNTNSVSAIRTGVSSFGASAYNIASSFLRSFVATAPENPEAGAPAPRENGNFNPGMRIERGARNEDDDENLMSNGNGVQFGWNPRDGDQD